MYALMVVKTVASTQIQKYCLQIFRSNLVHPTLRYLDTCKLDIR